MTFKDALAELSAGKFIKLPEWTGYWFKNGAIISVFCKNGDILDTPDVEMHMFRQDWEITDGALGFDFALLALKNKKKVRRKAWKQGDFITFIDGKGFYFIEVSTEHGTRSWQIKHIDLLANDWELANV